MINNRYELKKFLGKGRSNVFLCCDSRSNANLAIKILSKNASAEEKKLFIDEYFLLRNLNHKNIIKVFDRGTISKLDSDNGFKELEIGDAFFTLEYANGKPLDNYTGKLTEEQFLETVKQISSVLLYLHSSCFVYFDLKFENIFVSEDDGNLQIKFIDFGFTRRIGKGVVLENAIGSIQYIAPEIIKKGSADHRSDLYSLGILLYKLIYSKFPFEGTSELDIVKEHLEKYFEFSPADYSQTILDAVNKLMSKNPSDRFQNILELLDYLGIKLDKIDLQDILPIPKLIGRDKHLSIIDNWLNDESSSELVTIKGGHGSGKTFLLQNIEHKHPHSFVISSQYVNSKNFHQNFLEDLVLKDFGNEGEYIVSEEILININQKNELPFEEIKKKLFDIVSTKKPILIFDDFNSFPSFQREIFTNLFPVFQINGAKIIIAINANGNEIDSSLKNYKTLHLTAFTEENIITYCEETFNSFFPKDDLQKLYLKYSDKYPSHLIDLHRELYLFDLLYVEQGNFTITKDYQIIKQLDLSQGKLYDLKLKKLTEFEKSFVNIAASFVVEVHLSVVCKIMDVDTHHANMVTASLRASNILSFSGRGDSLKFSSESMKEFVYQSIEDKKSLHLLIAKSLSLNEDWYNTLEIATQFEKAEEYDKAFFYYWNEIESSEKISAYNNVKEILFHLKEINFDRDKKFSIDKKLCDTYKNIGDFATCLQLLDQISNDFPQRINEFDLVELKGLCLKNIGKTAESKIIFEELLSILENDSRSNMLNFQLASIELKLNNYPITQKICEDIINSWSASYEIKGRAYNLLALVEIYHNNNLDSAKQYFEEALKNYTKENVVHLISRVKVNLGNIYNMVGDFERAESYWDDALKLNVSIGDLEQQALQLMNYGIYKFERLGFEEAISFYTKANKIFETLGNKKGVGLTLYNFSEVYYEMCSYQKACNYIREAEVIFNEIDNTEELIAVLIFQAAFYFELEDKSSFNNVLRKFKILLKQKTLIDKYVKEAGYLKFLSNISKKAKVNKKNVKELIAEFDKSGQSSIAVKILFLLTDYLLVKKSYDEAIELVTAQDYKILIDKNLFWKAEKLYCLGQINSKKKKKLTEQILDYYTEALNLIVNEQITGITWKVVLEISNFYAYRGVIYKAEIYLKYLKEIFNYVIDQFIDVELKWKFESSAPIKRVYNKIHSITNLIYK